MFTLLEMLQLSDKVLLEECHEKLIMDYNTLCDAYKDASKKNTALIKSNCDFFNKIVDLQNENWKLKEENEELKRRTDNQKETLGKCTDALINDRSKYDELEQKYWDAQRTIDQYARENEDLKKERTICSTRIKTYKLKNDISKSEQHIDERTAKFWQNRYEEANKERINLRNKLAVEKVKRENVEKYLVDYQKLYSDECEKNRALVKAASNMSKGKLDAPFEALQTLVNAINNNNGKDYGTDKDNKSGT